MRNLKRVLTMVMAVAMMMSMMVVGAGATAFPDDSDIVHKAAVEKMVSLGIIAGDDTGKFNPKGIVTRAEMAKMIAVALNGGVDPKPSPLVAASFDDIKGHWAEGYIEYCVNYEIVAGLDANTFGPDQTVTPAQAAKMLLVGIGYDAEFENFVGPTWALNSNKIAVQKGLYDDIQTIPTNEGMTRDNAAQMIANFTVAKMVKYEFGFTSITGETATGVKQATDIILGNDTNGNPTYQTVLKKYYNLREQDGYMTSIGYDSKKKEYGYALTNAAGAAIDTYYTTADFTDLYGMHVTVLYSKKSNGNAFDRSTDSIYDINTKDSVIVAEGVMTDLGKFDAAKNTLKFDGVTYDIENQISYTSVEGLAGLQGFTGTDAILVNSGTNGATEAGSPTTDSSGNVTGMSGSAITDPYSVRLLDNDDDGKIDTFVINPFRVQKVSYVGSDSITFAAQGTTQTANGAVGNIATKDMVAYEGIAKDDIVAYYYSANNAERIAAVEKMELKEGTVSQTRGSGATEEFLIDGTWYEKDNANSIKAGDKVSFAAVGSRIFYSDVIEAEATSRNVLVIYQDGVWDEDVYGEGIGRTRVIFGLDGTTKSIPVAKVDGMTVVENTGDDSTTVNYNKANLLVVGQTYTYKINSDNEYELTSISNSNLAGHDGQGTGTYNNKKIGGFEIADNATILVVSDDNKANKYTGAEIKRNYGSTTIGGQQGAGAYFYDENNGFNYITLATIHLNAKPSFTTGLQYGFLTADAGTSVIDGSVYRNFTVWTADGEKVIKEKDSSGIAGFTEGQVITYNIVDGELAKDVKIAGVETGLVENFDDTNKDKIQLDGVQYEIDKDTQVFNVKTSNNTGVPGNAIVKGDTTNRINNAYYIVNPEGKKVDLVIVDLDGAIAPLGNVTFNGDVTTNDGADALQVALTNGLNVTIKGNFAPSKTVTVAANATLTVNGNIAKGESLVGAEGATLKLTNGADIAYGSGGAFYDASGNAITTGTDLTADTTFVWTLNADNSNVDGWKAQP